MAYTGTGPTVFGPTALNRVQYIISSESTLIRVCIRPRQGMAERLLSISHKVEGEITMEKRWRVFRACYIFGYCEVI